MEDAPGRNPASSPILVLGGSGVFGGRVCRRLVRDRSLPVIAAGRNGDKAKAFAKEVRRDVPDARIEGMALPADRLEEALSGLRPAVLVHAAGPFQGQDYAVAEACIRAGIPYVDLADGREFVTGFSRLDAAARAAGVLAVTGASTVPGLSAAVIDDLRADFARLGAIRIGIAPGNRAPRGLAVIEAILGYTGKPVPVRRGGVPATVHGWQDLKRIELPGLGKRWFSACDVPDLDLLPTRFPELQEVSFHAGLELGPMHLGLWALSWPVRWGLVPSLAPLAPLIQKVAGWFESFGCDRGGMFVHLAGTGRDGLPLERRWTLIAERGDGPWIPAIPAALVARRLASGQLGVGAMACGGLFTVADFMAEVADLAISTRPE